MAKENLFSILARSPWWVSVLIAGGLFALVGLFLPAFAAVFAALPFLGIAGYAAWRQIGVPGAASVADTLATLRAMPWEEFSALIGEAFRRDGYAVTAIAGGAADFELHRKGRVSVVSCRRWKVAQTGVGPLRELFDAMRSRDAHECIYVAAGGFTPPAREFATEKSIRLLSDAALAQLVGKGRRGKRRWSLR